MNNLDLLFIHITKCGGTTLRLLFLNKMKDKYMDDEIFVPEKKNTKINFYSNQIEQIEKLYDINKIKVVLSHCYYNDIKHIMKINSKFMFTFLRDPIERVISQYYYFYYPENKINMDELPEPEFNNFCKTHGNGMCFALGLSNQNIIDNNNLLESRLNEFNLIGKVEYFNEGVEALDLLINKEFNMSNSINYNVKLNENKNKKILSDYLKNKIRPFCKLDYILYNSFDKFRLLLPNCIPLLYFILKI